MGVTVYVRGGDGVTVCRSLDGVRELLEDNSLFWIDATSIDEPLRVFLQDTLRLHPLAVEDILLERIHPKIEDYGDYLYVVIHGVTLDGGDPMALRTAELDVVLTDRWVFTHHAEGFEATALVRDDLLRNPKLMDKGPSFVAHAVMDRVVDSYQPVMDLLDHAIDAIDAEVLDDPGEEIVQRISKLKRSLQRLRRIALHQREVMLRLSRGEFAVIAERALPFFRDIHDHCVRVADLSDSYRERLSNAFDVYLSILSNRMNQAMRALSAVATVMLPLTFIAGLYGMNFEHMPELHWHYGYLWALGLMGTVGAATVWYFRRKGWM